MDCSLPGSSVRGIFHAIVREWIAISFSRGSSLPRDRTRVSHIVDRCLTVWATREVCSMLNLCELIFVCVSECLSWWWVWVCLCQSDYVIRFLFECVNVPVSRLRVSTSSIWLGFSECESVRMHVKSMNVSMSLFLSALGCCSVTQSCPTLCNPMDCSMPGFPVLHYFLEFAQTLVLWVSGAIQPSHPLLPLSPPALNLSQHQGLFPMSPIFPPVGQRTGTSASASVLPMNVQDWFPLELTSLISLLSNGLSRVFSSITICAYQFFGAQPSLWSNSHIRTWLLEKIIALTMQTFLSKMICLPFKTPSTFVKPASFNFSCSNHLQWFWSPRK